MCLNPPPTSQTFPRFRLVYCLDNAPCCAALVGLVLWTECRITILPYAESPYYHILPNCRIAMETLTAIAPLRCVLFHAGPYLWPRRKGAKETSGIDAKLLLHACSQGRLPVQGCLDSGTSMRHRPLSPIHLKMVSPVNGKLTMITP